MTPSPGRSQKTTVMDIVKKFLKDNGFDGLFNVNGECACDVKSLCPCDGEITECEPGYRIEGCICGQGCDYHIVRDKPEGGKMNPYEKKHTLDGLDALSIENLQAGRITVSAMAFAVKACVKYYRDFNISCLGGALGGSSSDRMLADMLNDMLEAAKPSEEAAPPEPTPSEYAGIEGFIPELKATVRECIGCGCLVPGGPTRCKRCAGEVGKKTDDKAKQMKDALLAWDKFLEEAKHVPPWESAGDTWAQMMQIPAKLTKKALSDSEE